MNKSIILTILAALTMTTSLVGAQFVTGSVPGPAYLAVSSFSAVSQDGNLAKLSVTTGGDIPKQPDDFINSNIVVGIAWADLDTGKVFVTTIHPVLGRDSNQNPDAWHAHTATLSGEKVTKPHDFCIASIDSTPTAGISIQGNTMNVNVDKSSLPVPPEAFDAAVGFTIQLDGKCASGLAVQISA